MSFDIGRDELLEPLHMVSGVVERKQTLPILTHLLCEVSNGLLTITGSDQEIEMSASCPVESTGPTEFEFTVPGRKLFDICRNLPAKRTIHIEPHDTNSQLQCDRFRSQFTGLPSHDFPRVNFEAFDLRVTLPVIQLKDLLERAAFAMAQQDVRYFFNGMLFEFSEDQLKVVATNGQRLAIAKLGLSATNVQIIVPRKAVAEILRMTKGEGEAELLVSQNHLRVIYGQTRLTTKLIDATYPDYNRAVPDKLDKHVTVDRIELKSALNRISILSNELYRNVRLTLGPGEMRLNANNPMQEEAEELLEVDYVGESVEIGFNVGYLTDVLSVMSGDKVELSMSESTSPMLIKEPRETAAQYVISPMVL